MFVRYTKLLRNVLQEFTKECEVEINDFKMDQDCIRNTRCATHTHTSKHITDLFYVKLEMCIFVYCFKFMLDFILSSWNFMKKCFSRLLDATVASPDRGVTKSIKRLAEC